MTTNETENRRQHYARQAEEWAALRGRASAALAGAQAEAERLTRPLPDGLERMPHIDTDRAVDAHLVCRAVANGERPPASTFFMFPADFGRWLSKAGY